MFMLALMMPICAFAERCSSEYYGEKFPYEYYIERHIQVAEKPLNIPYDRASGESEIETAEHRHWYWSGWWHAMKQLQWQSKYHYHTS